MTAHESLVENDLSDRVLTQLQETGLVYLSAGKTLAQVISLVETLGIDPNRVTIITGGRRQFGLRVTGGGIV